MQRGPRAKYARIDEGMRKENFSKLVIDQSLTVCYSDHNKLVIDQSLTIKSEVFQRISFVEKSFKEMKLINQ